MEALRGHTSSLWMKKWRTIFLPLIVPDPKSKQVSTRIPSIESFRVLAILAVIIWHTNVLSVLWHLTDGSVLVALIGNMIWWIGVPYFCIVAGYFFHQTVLQRGKPFAVFQGYATPLLWLLVVWVCIYIAFPPSWPSAVARHGWWQSFYLETLKNLHVFFTQHIGLFLEGHRPVWHLWFLPALLMGLAILTMIEVCGLQKYVIYVIIALYLFAMSEEVAGGSFFNGIHLGTWAMATLFTAIGWWLVCWKQPSVRLACGVLLTGFVVALMEGAAMKVFLHSSSHAIRDHHYFGGILLGLGIVLFALAKPNLGQSTLLPFLGRFTLGVYLSHVLILYTLTPFFWRLPIGYDWKQFLMVPAVYIFAVLFSYGIEKVPVVKYLVVRPVWWDHQTVQHVIFWRAIKSH